MKFLIRDDDTCGFTDVEELENCYKGIIPHIPICLSVTPFRISREGDSFSHKKILHQPYPLEKNMDIVDFLKKGIKYGHICISLHGYHHYIDPPRNTRKVNWNDTLLQNKEYLYGENLNQKTNEGKKYLESLLGCRINTFVPPSNSISKNGIRALIDNCLNLIGTPSLWHPGKRPFNVMNFINAFKIKSWKVKHNGIYPFIIDFNDHKEIMYFTLYPRTDLEQLKKKLDFVYKMNGTFVLGTHYQAFGKKIKSGERMKDALDILVDYASKKDNIEFISYNELW